MRAQLSVRLPSYVTVFLAKRLYFRAFCQVFFVDSCLFFFCLVFVCFFSRFIVHSCNALFQTLTRFTPHITRSLALYPCTHIRLSLTLSVFCRVISALLPLFFSCLRKCFSVSVQFQLVFCFRAHFIGLQESI